MKKKPQLGSVVAFDGACLKLRRHKGAWVCEPTAKPAPARKFTNKIPRHMKRRS